jgi:hypothetical protein
VMSVDDPNATSAGPSSNALDAGFSLYQRTV